MNTKRPVIILLDDVEALRRTYARNFGNLLPDAEVIALKSVLDLRQKVKEIAADNTRELRCMVLDNSAGSLSKTSNSELDVIRNDMSLPDGVRYVPTLIMSGYDIPITDNHTAFVMKGEAKTDEVIFDFIENLAIPEHNNQLARNHNAQILIEILKGNTPEMTSILWQNQSLSLAERDAAGKDRIDLLRYYTKQSFKDGAPDKPYLDELKTLLANKTQAVHMESDSLYNQQLLALGELKDRVHNTEKER